MRQQTPEYVFFSNLTADWTECVLVVMATPRSSSRRPRNVTFEAHALNGPVSCVPATFSYKSEGNVNTIIRHRYCQRSDAVGLAESRETFQLYADINASRRREEDSPRQWILRLVLKHKKKNYFETAAVSISCVCFKTSDRENNPFFFLFRFCFLLKLSRVFLFYLLNNFRPNEHFYVTFLLLGKLI